MKNFKSVFRPALLGGAFLITLLVITGRFTFFSRSPQEVMPSTSLSPTHFEKPSSSVTNEAKTIFTQANTQNKIESETQKIQRKLAVLDEVFSSKNDNDPRLDQDFKNLSPIEKRALEEKYENLKVEQRNERGTIVFLLGKNIESNKDLDFFKKVLLEEPCLNLENCSQPSRSDHSSESSGMEITLNYPQIIALKSLQKFQTQTSREIIETATKSKSRTVSLLAKELLNSRGSQIQ